ncbi:MAG: acyl carrier protein [Candidatus Omnitrophica bacterium]|nr:acyl carrier protein [Candidatus Omnitrophota bacterium]
MNQEEIIRQLKDHIFENYPAARKREDLPVDESLYDSGILDSFGIVELVTFIENHWSIWIEDREITKEKFGGLRKMASLIEKKLQQKNLLTGPS